MIFKTKTLALFILLIFTLMLVGSCATLNIALNTKEKVFLTAQKEFNAALRDYKVFLFSQSLEDQAKLHEKYDSLIKGVSAALDAWEQVVKGITLDTGQMQEFMRIKNELILAGWTFFKEKGGE
jgi:hypothetical protein